MSHEYLDCHQKERVELIEQKIQTMEVRQVQIQGDVSHIKARLDNGMSHTIKDIHDNLTELKPIIKHHADIVKRIEDIGWLISRWVIVGLIGTLIGLILWAVSKGFNPL